MHFRMSEICQTFFLPKFSAEIQEYVNKWPFLQKTFFPEFLALALLKNFEIQLLP